MLTLFGSLAVTIMFLAYWLEQRFRWRGLIFRRGFGADCSLQRTCRVLPDYNDRSAVGTGGFLALLEQVQS